MSLAAAILCTLATFTVAIGTPLLLLWLWGNAPR